MCNFVGFTLTRNKLLAEHLRFTHLVKDFTIHNLSGRNQMAQCLPYVTVNAWKTSHIDLAIKSNITRVSTRFTYPNDVTLRHLHAMATHHCTVLSVCFNSTFFNLKKWEFVCNMLLTLKYVC